MRYEWDSNKYESNLKKHHIAFELAQLVFDDPLALSFLDVDHSEMEDRWITVGQVGYGHLIVVVIHTFRGSKKEEVIRIISARKATPLERKQYMNFKEGAK